MAKQVIGKNVKAELNGKILTVEIDVSEDQGVSGGGKSNICATTSGFYTIPGTDRRLGINCLCPLKD